MKLELNKKALKKFNEIKYSLGGTEGVDDSDNGVLNFVLEAISDFEELHGDIYNFLSKDDKTPFCASGVTDYHNCHLFISNGKSCSNCVYYIQI